MANRRWRVWGDAAGGALAIVLGAALGVGESAWAQAGQWRAASGLPGVNSSVEAAAAWDPDGVGPEQEWLVVVGQYITLAGETPATGIAAWDGERWRNLGAGLRSFGQGILAVGTHQGRLLVGGQFTCAGSVGAQCVAQWDGEQWTSLDAGAFVSALGGSTVLSIVEHGGDLYIGGRFDSIGGVTVNNLARWDGAAWGPVGGGVMLGFSALGVHAMASHLGRLVVAGQFLHAGETAVGSIAAWDGNEWDALGGGVEELPLFIGPLVAAALSTPQGLVVGGVFNRAGGQVVGNVARWEDATSSWLAMGSAPTTVRDLLLWRGQVVSVRSDGVFGWDGAAWVRLAPEPVDGRALATWRGGLVLGGGFNEVDGIAAAKVARFDGDEWRSLGEGITGKVNVLVADGPDATLVGGAFRVAGATPVRNIGRWNGREWEALGEGVGGGGAGSGVNAICRYGNDIVAGGVFTSVGKVAAANIARWDGQAWRPLGAGVSGPVRALAEYEGDLYAGGEFLSAGSAATARIARWDGQEWSGVAFPQSGGASGTVRALAVWQGKLYAGGGFDFIDGTALSRVGAWDGASWSALASGLPSSGGVNVLCPWSDALVVVGGFAIPGVPGTNRVATWNGAAWGGLGYPAHLSAPPPAASCVMDGDLLVAGFARIPSSVHVFDFITRYDGAAWSTFDDLPNLPPSALAPMGSGFVTGGVFQFVGTMPAPTLAQWTPGTFAPPQTLPAGANPSAVAAANFDGDALGRPDLAVANAGDDTVTMLFNTGTPGGGASFTLPTPARTHAVGAQPRAIVSADFNGDGAPDLAVANAMGASVSILLSTGGGGFSAGVTVATLAEPLALAADDLDGDDDPDLVVACRTGGRTLVFENLGDGAFVQRAALAVGTGDSPTGVGAGDLDNDKDVEVVVTDGALGAIVVFPGLGGFGFGPPDAFLINPCEPALLSGIALADLDADGLLDVAACAVNADEVYALRNNGNSQGGAWLGLGEPRSQPVGGAPVSIATGDLFGLGRADLVTANAMNDPGGSLSLLQNTSTGAGHVSFSPALRLDVPPDESFVAAADINVDQRVDLVIAAGFLKGSDGPAPSGTAAFLLNATEGLVAEPCAGDINGDRAVNFLDLNFVLTDFGGVGPALPGDLDGDGDCDFADLNIVLVHYGRSC